MRFPEFNGAAELGILVEFMLSKERKFYGDLSPNPVLGLPGPLARPVSSSERDFLIT